MERPSDETTRLPSDKAQSVVTVYEDDQVETIR
jgi:hypothetical protein